MGDWLWQAQLALKCIRRVPPQHLTWCSQKRKLKLPVFLNIPVCFLLWRGWILHLVHLDSVAYQLLGLWGFIAQDPLLTYTFSLNIVAEVRMQLCWLSSVLSNNSTIHDQKYFSNRQLLAAQSPLSSGDAYGYVEYKVRLCAGAV